MRKASDTPEAAVGDASSDKKSKRLSLKLRPKSGSVKSNGAWKALAAVLKPIGRVLSFLVPRYFINSWREVRKVTWPGRLETWRLTAAVFAFAIVFGAMVAGVDHTLDQIFKKLILK